MSDLFNVVKSGLCFGLIGALSACSTNDDPPPNPIVSSIASSIASMSSSEASSETSSDASSEASSSEASSSVDSSSDSSSSDAVSSDSSSAVSSDASSSSSSSEPPVVINLLADGDFEGSGDLAWYSWTGSSIERSTAEAVSGTQSMRVFDRADSGNAALDITSLVEAASIYDISAKVLVSGTTDPAIVRLTSSVKCADADTLYSWVQNLTDVTPDTWVDIGGQLTIEAGCTLEQSQIWFEGTGAAIDVYVDDVMLQLNSTTASSSSDASSSDASSSEASSSDSSSSDAVSSDSSSAVSSDASSSSSSSEPPVVINLLADGDFEGSGDLAWYSWNGSSIERSTAQAVSGTQSMRIFDREDNGNAALDITSLVEAGSIYDISAKVRVSGATDPETVRLTSSVACTGDETLYNWVHNLTDVAADTWMDLAGQLSIDAGCTLDQSQIWFEATGAGVDVYVDDVMIQLNSTTASSSSSDSSVASSSSASSVSAVESGKTLIQSTLCSGCHADNEDGTFGTLAFDVNNLQKVAEDSETALATYIADTMPTSDPTTCAGTCATDIAAYLWSYRTTSSAPVVALDSGWRASEGVTFTYVTGGVQYEPVANADQLVYDLASPLNLNGAQIMFEYEVDSAFMASGAGLQPLVQEKQDWNGHWSCWIGVPAATTGSYTCDVPATGWDITHDAGVQFGLQIPGADYSELPAGVVTITNVTIILAD